LHDALPISGNTFLASGHRFVSQSAHPPSSNGDQVIKFVIVDASSHSVHSHYPVLDPICIFEWGPDGARVPGPAYRNSNIRLPNTLCCCTERVISGERTR